jgi:VIT1/CCC1 family predicted Fe2+/Mn2+ transporter
MTSARPLQAALSSAAAFAVGAAFPIFSSLVIPHAQFVLVCSVICILVLGALGAVGARLGGAPVLKPALRVMFWGLVAVGFSTVVGTLMGTAIP